MVEKATAEIAIAVRDETGSRAYLRLHVSRSTPIAIARSAANSIAALLLSVSDCEVLGYNITYKTILAEPIEDDGVDEMKRAVFIFDTSADDEYGVIVVPGIYEALIQPDNQINTDDAGVANLVAQLVAGGYTNPFGYDLVDLGGTLYEIKP